MVGADDLPLVRFTIRGVPGMEFIRRPVSLKPPSGTIALVGGEGWQTAGTYRDGEWVTSNGKPFKRPVLFWIEMERPAHG